MAMDLDLLNGTDVDKNFYDNDYLFDTVSLALGARTRSLAFDY